MEINIKNSYSRVYLSIEAENVKIYEDLSEVFYHVDSDGKIDYNKIKLYDIKDSYMSDILRVAENLVYYREQPFDSTDLIKQLFIKMPTDKVQNLLKDLNNEYLEESEVDNA